MDATTTGDTFGLAPFPGREVFAARRERLLDRIGDGVAVVPSAPELLKSRDTEVNYRQSSDLYYLTGFPEPDSVAVVTPHDPKHRLTLFVRPRDPEREAWAGPRFGVDGAAAEFGADAVYPISEFDARLPDLLRPADRIHYPVGAAASMDSLLAEAVIEGRRLRQRTGSGPMGIVDLEVSTGEMRLLKDAAELERIRIAARIAAAAHVAAMRRTRAGAGEWEIQASLEAAFRSLGAGSPAFPSIVAAGANATVLHYVANQSRLLDGDLLLIDAGTEWGMYCSDITRTFPVSGRFTSSQRDLYDVVLAAQAAGIAAAQAGSPFTAIHNAVVPILVRGMIDLGILPPGEPEDAIESGAYRRFYLHQSSHWLGLDVHDAGPFRRDGAPVTLQPGMVLTVEPGVYIPTDALDVPQHFRGVGIRIEDDLILLEEGHEIVTRGVPVDPAAIEEVMRGD